MARNYRKADYAANKMNKDSIVYLTADGIVEVTFDDFLRENPGMTKEDFLWWKKWSDDEYKETDRKDCVEAKHTVSIYNMEETEALCIPSVEETFFEKIDSKEHSWEEAEAVLSVLGDVQRRRYLMFYMAGLTTVEIAKIEGVNQSSVSRAIQAAEKKIKKFLKKYA